MQKFIQELPDYTRIATEDLRLFPDGINWFIANIILMLIATAFGSMKISLDVMGIRPDIYMGLGFGVSVIISVLCILIIRGHLFPIIYLRAISGGLTLLAIFSAVKFFGEPSNILSWLGAIMAIVSLLILTSLRYSNLAKFYKRMMERQRATGLTRAEDIMIHLLLEEGTKEGFENARSIVIHARERIKKSPH